MRLDKQAPLSVIIPTYNRAELLSRAVESVIRQSVLPREIIIVDDGSCDNSEQILKQFSGRTATDIKYHWQRNKGPAAARNLGIACSSQPVLAFLDSDDHWHKKKIEIQFNELCRDKQCRISHTKERWLRRGRHLNQKRLHQPPGGIIFSSCLKLCCVGMSTVMVEKALFDDYGGFDESLPCCEDYELWLRISLREPFLLIEEPLTVKEGGRDDQVSVIHRVGMDKYRIYALRKLLENETMSEASAVLAKTALLAKCEIYASGCLKHGKIEEAERVRKIMHTHRI